MDLEYLLNDSSSRSGASLLRTRPWVAYPYAVMVGVLAVVGTFGNLLIIGTLRLRHGRKHTVGNMFIINLTLSDIIVTSLINPFSIVGKYIKLKEN